MHRRKRKVYWISFMDGLQRVLLLTENPDLQNRAGSGGAKEPPHTEFSLSLIGTGLSLVDDLRGQEVAYIGIPQYVCFISLHSHSVYIPLHNVNHNVQHICCVIYTHVL